MKFFLKKCQQRSKLCGKKVESELIEGIACGGKDCIFRI